MALKFGTSGVRGLASEFTRQEVQAFVTGFVERLEALKLPHNRMIVAGDYRASTPEIFGHVVTALTHHKIAVLDAGRVPTPALAVACAAEDCPGIMITGSHIPGDRNGIKFYFASGEILKSDEAAILASHDRSVAAGAASGITDAPAHAPTQHTPKVARIDAAGAFLTRYTSFLTALAGPSPLRGQRVLVYEHSTVGRDLLGSVLQELGADVIPFGRSEVFIPVDTEALEALRGLGDEVRRHGADALVSLDGDADRPLIIDDRGEAVPGDLLGLLTARALSADHIVCTVSCNTAIESARACRQVHRTQIGSPFVLTKMIELIEAHPGEIVTGFEANGGFLLGTPPREGELPALMTRDSFLPILMVLLDGKIAGGISQLLAKLPPRFTCSGLIKNFQESRTRAVLGKLDGLLEKEFGAVSSKDLTDGTRVTLADGRIVHFRPSGNAPEFRIYAEASSPELAANLCEQATRWVQQIAP